MIVRAAEDHGDGHGHDDQGRTLLGLVVAIAFMQALAYRADGPPAPWGEGRPA